MKLKVKIYLCSIAFGLVACGKSETTPASATLDDAMELYAEGNVVDAADMCDVLAQQGDTARMGWKDNCRMATIYAMAYDRDYRTETSMASATLCLDKAYRLQPDSVTAYANSLPVDESGVFNTALQTLNGLYVDDADLREHEEDEPGHEEDHVH